jgi:hypothetical protein
VPSVDPRSIYGKLYGDGANIATSGGQMPIAQNEPWTGWGYGASGMPANNPFRTSAPPASTDGSGSGYPAGSGHAGTLSPLWTKFLGLARAGDPGNPEAAGAWAQQSGDDKSFFRRNQRGFDLFGLAPQTAYWENLAGSGLDREATTRRSPDSIWGAYQNQSAGLPHFLEQNLKDLTSVWSQFSDPEQQMWRDRLLSGSGLPSYLQAFQQARPTWINDYLSNALPMSG